MQKETIYKIETRTGSGTTIKFTKDRPKSLDDSENYFNPLKFSSFLDFKILTLPNKKALKNKKSK